MRGGSQKEGIQSSGLAQQPRWLSYGPGVRRHSLSYLYYMWPQESLSPSNTNLEGMK